MQQLSLLDDQARTEPASPLSLPEPPAAPLPQSTDGDGTTPTTLPSGLAELLSPGLGDAISGAFSMMEIAEEEIDCAQARCPMKSDEINQSFRFLRPTEVLSRTSEDLYRLHAREIIDRVATGQNLRPGTDAEVVAALCEITLAAPPARELTLLYMKIFSRLFPDKAGEFFEGITPDLFEEERMGELESELRRKLATERDCRV